jgi:hypothetical protein
MRTARVDVMTPAAMRRSSDLLRRPNAGVVALSTRSPGQPAALDSPRENSSVAACDKSLLPDDLEAEHVANRLPMRAYRGPALEERC